MKKFFFALCAVLGFTLLAPQAEAGGSRYRSSYYNSDRECYGGPSYRTRTRYYYDDCYRPSYSYHRPVRVYRSYDDCYPRARYYSRPRFSVSFGF